jgi:hypothetical protein
MAQSGHERAALAAMHAATPRCWWVDRTEQHGVDPGVRKLAAASRRLLLSLCLLLSLSQIGGVLLLLR